MLPVGIADPSLRSKRWVRYGMLGLCVFAALALVLAVILALT